MVRFVVLGLALLAVGFMLGVAYSAAELPPPSQAGPPNGLVERAVVAAQRRDAGQVARDIEEIRTAIHALRLAAATAPEWAPSGGAAASLPAGSKPSSVEPSSGDGTATEAEGVARRRPDPARLAQIEDWSERGATREKWMLAAERNVLEWFGTPDEMASDGGGEWWTYWRTANGMINHRYRFRISSGRVISFAQQDEDPPQPVLGTTVR